MSDPLRRAAFLQEMGLGPVWLARQASAAVAEYADVPDSDFAPEEPSVVERSPVPAAPAADAFTAPLQDAVAPVIEQATRQPASVVPRDDRADAIARMDWTQLQETVSECVQCGLCRNRTHTVFGVGDPQARWLFVGEGPGRNEDLQGQPFVGPAGKLLDNMMGAMGLQRGQNTFIANIVKCRPTDENRRDRPPSLTEATACMPYLKRQIELIAPTVIIALGKTAALSLLELDPATPVSRLRGSVHRYGEIPLVVTYHPAYLLRNLRDKRKTWADLCLAMQTFAARG